jgi:hypothetical protein
MVGQTRLSEEGRDGYMYILVTVCPVLIARCAERSREVRQEMQEMCLDLCGGSLLPDLVICIVFRLRPGQVCEEEREN